MSLEPLRKVADQIEETRNGSLKNLVFDMSLTISEEDHSCGTVGCVAGFLVINEFNTTDPTEIYVKLGASSVLEEGCKILDIPWAQGQELFCIIDCEFGFSDVNKHPKTPDALRWMADTGIPNWREAYRHLGVDDLDLEPRGYFADEHDDDETD
jgi:hypothetical protein